MNRGMKELRALAEQVVALQARARALGLFANDRELLECPDCGLMENVAAAGGGLFTCRPESLDEDTALRFEELSPDRFRCPACGATICEEESIVPATRKPRTAIRSCHARKPPS